MFSLEIALQIIFELWRFGRNTTTITLHKFRKLQQLGTLTHSLRDMAFNIEETQWVS